MKRWCPALLPGLVLSLALGMWAQSRTTGGDTSPVTTVTNQPMQAQSTDGNPNDPDRDLQIERERAFWKGRVSPDSQPSAVHLDRANQQKRALRRQAIAASVAAGTDGAGAPVWQSMGPSPMISDWSGSGFQDYGYVTGRMTAVAVDPTDTTGNTVYVGGAYGGLWRSTNAATSNPGSVVWTPLFDSVSPTLAIGSIAIKPNDGNTIIVGTGEPNNAGDSYYGLGIMRSTDGGASWTQITQTSDTNPKGLKGVGIGAIYFHPNNPNFVIATASYAAEALGSYCSSCRGVYYSSDAGATWKSGTMTDNGTNFFSQSMHSVIYNPYSAKWYGVVDYHGLYVSSDGITWTRASVGSITPGAVNQPGGTLLSTTTCPGAPNPASAYCPMYRGALAMRPGANEMYVYFVDINETNQGVYRSVDGGYSWSQLNTATGFDNCSDGSGAGCGSQQGSYNMVLGAVPNGTGTDVYVGAVNMFKCSSTPGDPTCSAGFLNLTHVYACSPVASTAHVHPDQHGFDFVKSADNITRIIYFGNDGGIYRTLNAPGMTVGTCSGVNPFDNLNGTMGSITQFVGFSQHPTDSTIVLAGAQDNGTSAVSSSSSGSNGVTWTGFQGGDGGWNAIDQADPRYWYATYPNGTITRCAAGTSCRNGFYSIIDYTDYGTDYSAFYMPFILDPYANNGSSPATRTQLILGTCRVWRGPSTGSGWTSANALSYNFSTGTADYCNTGDTIHALAAGGPKSPADNTGVAQVIYAGTDIGELWVTTNAAGGPTTWAKRLTVANGTPISSIAMDATDATGKTAYVTVMGFGVPHVYRTADAGATMVNITGNLPDAPADSVAIDPVNNKIIYVGTDVGVYYTTLPADGITVPTWAEWGPTSGTGSLPNVPVTKLDIFNNGTIKKVRASTYGRGVWQIDLASSMPAADFSMSLTRSSVSVYASTNATFSGTLTALNGFSGSVTVSCTGATLPSTCTGGTFTPSAGGASFSVTAANTSTGTYNFTIQAVGGGITKTVNVTLYVVNLTLSTPSPSSVSVKAGQTSSAMTFNVTPAGPVNNLVSLSCAGLPVGTICSFSPNFFMISTSPQVVTLTVPTAANTAVGTYTITVDGAIDLTAFTGFKTSTFSLTVTSGTSTPGDPRHRGGTPVRKGDKQPTTGGPQLTPKQPGHRLEQPE